MWAVTLRHGVCASLLRRCYGHSSATKRARPVGDYTVAYAIYYKSQVIHENAVIEKKKKGGETGCDRLHNTENVLTACDEGAVQGLMI
ncbi:hypothetical protein E2C01_042906 [Portunus trituberculatus]|uniref:Uncharacterized protein n=1 Tax=Portunus trituberculatus TaxID=210409 RepID=A0A5B7FRH1_PORTR|nr:hypothetical protein [Portunus trituberculatus]